MTKTNEEWVEEFQNKDHIITSDGGLYVAIDAHWLRTTLTTYGNARVEEIIKIAEGMKDAQEKHKVIKGWVAMNRGEFDLSNMTYYNTRKDVDYTPEEQFITPIEVHFTALTPPITSPKTEI